jgi:hypothetical protein
LQWFVGREVGLAFHGFDGLAGVRIRAAVSVSYPKGI